MDTTPLQEMNELLNAIQSANEENLIGFADFLHEDGETATAIANRAKDLPVYQGTPVVEIMLDLAAVHFHTPLRLEALLAADDFNFAHDMGGIAVNLNRNTGELMNCFLPRFAA